MRTGVFSAEHERLFDEVGQSDAAGGGERMCLLADEVEGIARQRTGLELRQRVVAFGDANDGDVSFVVFEDLSRGVRGAVGEREFHRGVHFALLDDRLAQRTGKHGRGCDDGERARRGAVAVGKHHAHE